METSTQQPMNIPAPLMQQMAQALMKQLQGPASELSPFAHVLQHMIAQKATQLAAQQVVAGVSPATPTTRLAATPPGLNVNPFTTPEPGTSISRSNSNVSNSSCGSLISRSNSNVSNSSCGSLQDFESGSAGGAKGFVKRRKPTKAEQKDDSKVLTNPLLRRVDALCLAPHPEWKENPMFQFKYKRGGGRKKTPDMVHPFVKKEIRAVVRQAVVTNLVRIQKQDPEMTFEMLRVRYNDEAVRIIKKRRANHVQWWREDMYGSHKPLVYGGQLPAAALRFRKPRPLPEKIILRARRDTRRRLSPVAPDQPVDSSTVNSSTVVNSSTSLEANNCIGCGTPINSANPSVGETQRCLKCYRAVDAEPANKSTSPEPEPSPGAGKRARAESEPGAGKRARAESEPGAVRRARAEPGAARRARAEPEPGAARRAEPEPEPGAAKRARTEPEPEPGAAKRARADPEGLPGLEAIDVTNTTSATASRIDFPPPSRRLSLSLSLSADGVPPAKCSACGLKLTKETANPKATWGKGKTLWCETCWKPVYEKMIIENISDPDKRKAKLAEMERRAAQGKTDAKNKVPKTGGKSATKGKKTCKWCGSTTHSRRSSLKCPHNKKFKSQVEESQQPITEEESQQPITEEESQQPESQQPETEDARSGSETEDAPLSGSETEDEFNPLSHDPDYKPTVSVSAEPSVPRPTATRPSNRETTLGAPPTTKPQQGDNVLVNCGKQTFLAQLFKVEGEKYHVYYVGNSEEAVVTVDVLTQVPKEKCRKREDYIGCEFYSNKFDLLPGRWKIDNEVVDKNNFECIRLSGGTPPDCQAREEFDISYAMDKVREDEEYRRERGPRCKGRF